MFRSACLSVFAWSCLACSGTGSGPGGGSGTRADGGAEPGALALPDRAAFAAELRRITTGQTEAEVLAILGQPDRRVSTALLWGGRIVPTLGSVFLDGDGRVAQVFGGAASRRIDLPEPRLRAVLGRLFALPELDASSYSPVPVIEAVQALLPLGKTLALDVVDEYLRVVPRVAAKGGPPLDPEVPVGPRTGLFAVLRVLFAVPETPGHHPRVDLGSPWPAEPEDPTWFPRFPIALVDDVPYLVMRDYESTGYAQPVEDHVAYFRAHGLLREAALDPGREGRTALESLVQQVRRRIAWDPPLEAFLAAQFSTLADTKDR